MTPEELAAIVRRDQEWSAGFAEDPEVGDEYLEKHDETECQADRDRHELLMELLVRDAKRTEADLITDAMNASEAAFLRRAGEVTLTEVSIVHTDGEPGHMDAAGAWAFAPGKAMSTAYTVPTLRAIGYDPPCDYCDEGDPVVAGWHIRIDPEGIDPTAKVPCGRAHAYDRAADSSAYAEDANPLNLCYECGEEPESGLHLRREGGSLATRFDA